MKHAARLKYKISFTIFEILRFCQYGVDKYRESSYHKNINMAVIFVKRNSKKYRLYALLKQISQVDLAVALYPQHSDRTTTYITYCIDEYCFEPKGPQNG